MTKDEYEKLYLANHRIEGYGLDVTQHVPCPFCAAPDWQEWPIASVTEAMEVDTKCGSCGRSARAIVTRSEGGVSVEMVQTGGPDPPDYLVPPPRRWSPPERVVTDLHRPTSAKEARPDG